MSGNADSGLWAWKQSSNHNRMIALQADPPVAGKGPVELAYFGSSAFRITSPGGISVMIDPWRNHPSGKWDWYFHDFPIVAVDIGVSTHAHFDHDALHRLDAHVLLDRPIGRYTFGDVTITGLADKHAIDSTDQVYDFRMLIREFDGIDIAPPDNPRSWDHCLILVETGGLRILHWGDNRPDPPERIWQALGRVDLLLVPADDSCHVMGFGAVQSIIDRLCPRLVVPHHYYIWNVIQRQSTLQVPDQWAASQPNAVWLDVPAMVYHPDQVAAMRPQTHLFGPHVAFDTGRWLAEGR